MEEKKEREGEAESLSPETPQTGRLRGRSRKRTDAPEGKKKAGRIALAAVIGTAVLAAAGAGYYFLETGKYKTAFFPNTTINGINASGKTVEEVKSLIEAGLSGYTLTVQARDGASGTIGTEEIGLHSEFDGSLEKLLEEQEPGQWIRYLKEGPAHEIRTMIAFDGEKLKEAVREFPFMDPDQMREPENARISEYDSGTRSYSVVPAVQGTELVEEPGEKAVAAAIVSLSDQVDLDAEGCYTKPAVDETDEGLNAAAAEMNRYVGAVVTHTFGDAREVLDGDTISQWITVDGGNVTLDESQAAAYVKELAGKYDTAYKTKTLKTSYGKDVTISRGHYGWKISQAAETAAVLSIIKNGEQQTREPEYSQKAASRGANDYGSTYVEINLTAQHLYFYKNGELLVETDFVSGNESRGWATPGGAYPLTYKQRNATLRGEGYATPVSYWMPFNGGIGLHDASWRGSFGGTIYKTGGSHGCINLPPKAAKTIFENISQGDPVLCYHLAGTESKKTAPAEKPAATTAASTAASTAAPETTAAPAPEQTQPPTEQPVGPSVELPEGNTDGPGGGASPEESSPQETPASPVETAPAVPGPVGPSVTAGGDEESFGPGFADPAPEPMPGPGGPGA